jgi:hypothetical protein
MNVVIIGGADGVYRAFGVTGPVPEPMMMLILPFVILIVPALIYQRRLDSKRG